ncbi:tectonic-3-like [Xyrauchen texanus]|uniref:tectonic-3-like n=1 Tax=Xyrauchen texanus TaxID=154827 RepID=UPI0022425CFD|nr:tectonic-3-like [Xyrauchen texanus]
MAINIKNHLELTDILSQMTTRVFCRVLILFAVFYPKSTHCQSFSDPTAVTDSMNTTQTFTDQTSTDRSQYPFTFTDKPPTTSNQLPLITAAATDPSVTAALTTDSVLRINATILPITNLTDCPCDVTPDFCDIGCCCDVIDCGLLNLSSVFNGCSQDTRSGVCLESWLMFRANIDPALVTLKGNLFCVQREEELQSGTQTSSAVSQSSPLYPLSVRDPTAFNRHKYNFYKVDDIILTYYNSTSIVSTLRQPSPGPATSTCVNRNPARFLRSSSLSCSRMVTARSCVDDSSLNAQNYYTDFSILKVPRAQMENRAELIPLSTVRDWPEPHEQIGLCLNVVSKVEYAIKYTGKGEIVQATVNIELMNTSTDTQLLQKHTVVFELATPTPPVATPTPSLFPEGLKPGSPVIGWFAEKAQPLTVMGLSEDGGCSAGLTTRPAVLFKQNTMTGCTFRSSSSECAVLRAELLGVLTGAAVPDLLSMTAGSQTDRTQVITEDCSVPASGEVCETCCLLPVSLSVRVLWAQTGLRALPQNHILGAKYIFSCQRLKCPLRSFVPVTIDVTFSEATVYPESPRGEPQPEWKFPFDFFSRGAGEFDQE